MFFSSLYEAVFEKQELFSMDIACDFDLLKAATSFERYCGYFKSICRSWGREILGQSLQLFYPIITQSQCL